MRNAEFSYSKALFIFIFTGIISGTCFSFTLYAQDSFHETIMKVQQNNQRLHDSVELLSFTGKSKSYFFAEYDAMEMEILPETEEYNFIGLWTEPDSLRVILTALRKTKEEHPAYYSSGMEKPDYYETISNSFPLPSPFRFAYDISPIGMKKGMRKNKAGQDVPYWPLYPFAIGADSLYNYEYVSEISVDARKIIQINVSPKFSDIPAVSGLFQIDASDFIVISSDVTFNRAAGTLNPENNTGSQSAASFPFSPIRAEENRRIISKKALYSSVFWMPESVEESLEIMIMGMTLKMHSRVDFTSYEFNQEANTIEFEHDQSLLYAIDPNLQNKLNEGLENPNALSFSEREEIISSIRNSRASRQVDRALFDKESIAFDAFQRSLGQNHGSLFRISKTFNDVVQYNRIDGFRFEYGVNFSNILIKNSSLIAHAGYGFADKKIKEDISWIWYPGGKGRFFIESGYYNLLGFEEQEEKFSNGKNTFSSLFFKTDYRDYFYKKGIRFGAGYKLAENFGLKFSANRQREKSAQNEASFSIFRNGREFRINPEIKEGDMLSISSEAKYVSHSFQSQFVVEYTDRGALKSDFQFTKFSIDALWEKRFRDMSSIFISFAGGGSNGVLPPQKWFDFGGKSLFNYKGSLRGVSYKEFTGDQMLTGSIGYSRNAGSFTYNFTRRSFLDSIRGFLKLHVWTGFGWSSLTGDALQNSQNLFVPTHTTDGLYSEFGFGISDILHIVRVDYIVNSLENNRILFSINFFK